MLLESLDLDKYAETLAYEGNPLDRSLQGQEFLFEYELMNYHGATLEFDLKIQVLADKEVEEVEEVAEVAEVE